MDEKIAPKKITINVRQDLMKGVYANAVRLSVNDNEVLLDLAFIAKDKNEPYGELVSRVIISPKFARRLADSISNTLDLHIKRQPK